MSRATRRYRKRKKNPSGDRAPSKNPTAFADIVEFAGPGFAAFAATRFGTRIISTQVAKHKPALGKHAGAVASVGAFLAAWLLAHRVKFLAKYHTPIVVGAAIAGLQSLIQLYIPRLGWMVADATPELAAGAPAAQQQSLSDVEELDEDPSMYVYNDSYDPGHHTQQQSAQRPQHYPPPPNQQKASEDDLMDLEMEEDVQQASGWAG